MAWLDLTVLDQKHMRMHRRSTTPTSSSRSSDRASRARSSSTHAHANIPSITQLHLSVVNRSPGTGQLHVDSHVPVCTCVRVPCAVCAHTSTSTVTGPAAAQHCSPGPAAAARGAK